jgi:excisionase family DNA binding protein
MTLQGSEGHPLAHTVHQAAAVLGMSPTTFRKEVLPEIKVVRRGRRVIVPRAELQQWLERNAAAV